MLKKVKDERLTKKELKCIKGLAILQNVVIFGLLVHQTIQKDVPAREIFNLSNPLFVAFAVFFIPMIIVENIIELLNEDENKYSQKKVLGLTFTFTLLFIGLVYLFDPVIGFTGIKVGFFATAFLFLFMQVVNRFRQ
ncbi:hypothetical protein [Tetragenococcus muriaticus]|uniref:hypothetical protein n=1 Tax=Tetragenococcus muriaticus TaxID=64642 RepID=UPI000412607A|nr:hypothetical protein [Tetragenococcus muriaticus]GMA46621.1 hypothetical protein GCM10025854_08710 [Tetragenococcus muriaticus]